MEVTINHFGIEYKVPCEPKDTVQQLKLKFITLVPQYDSPNYFRFHAKGGIKMLKVKTLEELGIKNGDIVYAVHGMRIFSEDSEI